MFPEHGCSSPVVSKDSEQSRFSLELNGIHCLCTAPAFFIYHQRYLQAASVP